MPHGLLKQRKILVASSDFEERERKRVMFSWIVPILFETFFPTSNYVKYINV